MSSNVLEMTPQERKGMRLLLVEPDKHEQQLLRSVLQTLGIGYYSFATGHHEGLAAFDQKKFSHIIFPALPTNMSAEHFVAKVFEINPTLILVPSSWNPNVEDVFSLLQLGAKGYLCKPFTCESVESALIQATKGEPLAQAILDARDRNEAFAALLAGCVDRLATVARQARTFGTARREVGNVLSRLGHSAHIARTFCRGTEDDLIDSVVDFFVGIAEGPATRLGRLRHRLNVKRQEKEIVQRPRT